MFRRSSKPVSGLARRLGDFLVEGVCEKKDVLRKKKKKEKFKA
jgi:hypothetical protein